MRNTVFKTLLVATVAIFLFGLLGSVAYAVGDIGALCDGPSDCNEPYSCDEGGFCTAIHPEGPGTPGEVLHIIANIGDWVFGIFIAISVIYIVMAAFQFVTGEGKPDKITEARMKLLYAMIGIAIALFAGAFDDIIRSIILNT
ncbi:MAG TPA: hypothetical protein ENI04_01690 [Candidatus Wildermuthbacteria bacterium]|nr:hypothetical protein [Candidatus Wildermuthbacteria bacterium]